MKQSPSAGQTIFSKSRNRNKSKTDCAFSKNAIDISAWPPEHSLPEQSARATFINRRAVEALVDAAQHVNVDALKSVQFVITGLLREIAQIKFTIE